MDITLKQINSLLKSYKGWEQFQTGNEYVYDYHSQNIPVIVKVLSSIPVDVKKKRNKNSDKIRVFVVLKEGMGKTSHILRGLIKAQEVEITTGWEITLRNTVINILKQASIVYYKQQRLTRANRF